MADREGHTVEWLFEQLSPPETPPATGTRLDLRGLQTYKQNRKPRRRQTAGEGVGGRGCLNIDFRRPKNRDLVYVKIKKHCSQEARGTNAPQRTLQCLKVTGGPRLEHTGISARPRRAAPPTGRTHDGGTQGACGPLANSPEPQKSHQHPGRQETALPI